MAFQLDIGFTSLAGIQPVNEDFCAAMLPEAGQVDMGCIVALADGVSTGGMGIEAAHTAVTSLVRDYYCTPATWDTTVALDRIIGAQNAWLAGINRRRKPAMGLTTLTAVVLRGQSYTVAHVGDSRAYLLRGGSYTQLSHDHVPDHPDLRHQLLRSVGVDDTLVVDYFQGDLQIGDVFVLVTDGVHGVLDDAQMALLARADDAELAAGTLVQTALQAGSRDNVTAIVVRVIGLLEATLEEENRAARTLPIPGPFRVGDRIDDLTVMAPVADNGINMVVLVRHPTTQTLYALKTLHSSRAHDPQERAMLAKRMGSSRAAEYWVALHATHPVNSVSGQTASAFYLLYDWHGGETLGQMLDRQRKFTVHQAVSAARQVALALGRMHQQNVVHRDIKPANLHQGEDGVLRLLDLGVALSGREPEAMRRLHAGTPSYVNPEQWGFSAFGGEAAEALPTPQSDLFALDVTLYQLLTHKLPYGEVLPYQVGRYYRDPIAPSRHNPEIPIWLDHVVQKAVARDKRLRFETGEEFLLALERGASRPLSAPAPSALLHRDPTAVWKLGLGVSLLLNFLLVFWLLFLPK